MPEVTAARTTPPVSISVRQTRQDLGLSRERMARLLDVSAKTIERWEERDTPPTNRAARERLARLREIIDLGLQVYTPAAFRQLMTLPTPALKGRTALQLIELGEIDTVYGEMVADYEGSGY